ncbi:MAG: azurin [Calditrichae bacterium]|nr:azurin [Calditrichota bacterium]MCB9057899.1 azurin [Calditrichia bacterium]
MRNFLKIFALFFLFILIACGGKKEEQAATDKPEMTGTPSDAFVVEVTGNDQMQFNVKTIEVPAGKKIRVNFKHVGQMPKETMGHNFIILKQDVDIAAFAARAMNAKETDYIPPADEQNIIAHTKLLGGGESTSIEFDAPPAGTYKFMCSFPGHYVMMQGDFIVK